jgi:hypothetical protein
MEEEGIETPAFMNYDADAEKILWWLTLTDMSEESSQS